MSATSPCEPNITHSADNLLKQLDMVVRENTMAITVCFLIIGISGVVIFFIGKMAWGVVRSHRQRVGKEETTVPPGAGTGHDDDIHYVAKDGMGADLPQEAEAARVGAKLARVAAQYSAYNRALSNKLKGRGKVPDDLIDERILSRDEDDFKYAGKSTTGIRTDVFA